MKMQLNARICRTFNLTEQQSAHCVDFLPFFLFLFFFCVSLAAINGTTINNLQVVFFRFFSANYFYIPCLFASSRKHLKI